MPSPSRVSDPAAVLLAVEDVAELLRVSTRTARRALQERPLSQFAFKRGRRWFILFADFERGLESIRGAARHAGAS